MKLLTKNELELIFSIAIHTLVGKSCCKFKERKNCIFAWLDLEATIIAHPHNLTQRIPL